MKQQIKFNEICSNETKIKYFDDDLEAILGDFVKNSGMTLLPLAIKALQYFLIGKNIECIANVFFTTSDLLIVLVSVVSSAAFVEYKYKKREILKYVCWELVLLSLGVYLTNTEYLSLSRSILWFLVSLIFSFTNILASQYIPENRRKA